MYEIYIRLSLLSVVIISLISGCTSLVYSPSLQLPIQPLQKEQVQAGVGMVLLPETRPSPAEQKTAFGVEGFVRYGFSDKFSMQIRYWNDVHSAGDANRAGFSFSGTHLLGDTNSKTRFGLTIGSGMLLNNYTLEPLGVSVVGSVWLPEMSNNLRPYCSVGILTGFHVSSTVKEWGAGLLLQGGLAWKLIKIWTLNFEGSFIGQANFYEDISHLIPSFSIASTISF
ncbi:MAG: hypothetical protein JST20_06165 [Bacteroidetes bacterium]|nr:hypothetical protein [Bacteroidota bacterium]